MKNGEVHCEYPFIRDPSCLSHNRHAAVKVAEKVEKDLLKDNLREVYNDQIRDQLKRGVAVRLSEEEMILGLDRSIGYHIMQLSLIHI